MINSSFGLSGPTAERPSSSVIRSCIPDLTDELAPVSTRPRRVGAGEAPELPELQFPVGDKGLLPPGSGSSPDPFSPSTDLSSSVALLC